MQRQILEGTKTLSKKGAAYVSASFSSIADTVKAETKGLCKGGARMTLYAFGEDGNRFEIRTTDMPSDDNGSFCGEYEFDPASLAVYQGAQSFEVELTSDTELEITEFCVCEIITEPSQMWQDKLNSLTTTEDGKPGVFVTQVSGEKIIVPRVPNKVLFVGNSLVFGMCGGKYGMCASAPDKDYFHYVTNHILKYNPSCTFTKLYGSYLEHSENLEMFDDWFYKDAMKQFSTDPLISAKDMLDPELDLIFLQIGDNVNTEEKLETFKTSAFIFMERVKTICPKARIIFVHSWYGINKTGPIIKAVSEKWDIERVDISSLHNLSTEAREQKTFLRPDGTLGEVSERWISHPGDLGMKKIADKIIERLAL